MIRYNRCSTNKK